MAIRGVFHGAPPDPLEPPEWAADVASLRALDAELDEPAGDDLRRRDHPRKRVAPRLWASRWPARRR